MSLKNNSHIRLDSADGIDTIVMQRVWHTRERMGAPLFNALLRGLVLADRLHTTGLLIVRIGDGKAGTPPSRPPLDVAGDERQALYWSTTAWMREFSEVMDDMIEAGIEGLLRLSPATLLSLRAITNRWRTQIFARMRNEVAVHLDADVIERGLMLARTSDESSAQLLTVAWNAEAMVNSQFRATFAHGVQIAGLFAPPWPGEDTGAEITAETAQSIIREAERVMGEIFAQSGRDQGALPGLMRALIFDCADALQLGDAPVPLPATKRAGHADINNRTKQELDVIGREIDGWQRTEGNVDKVRRLATALRELRRENKALRLAAKRKA